MLNVTSDPVQQVITNLNTSFTRKRLVLVKIPLLFPLFAKPHLLKRFIFVNKNNFKTSAENISYHLTFSYYYYFQPESPKAHI